MQDKELAGALSELQDNARRPPAEARTLPPALYHLESVFALEREKIFSREWLCLGRADELSESGQYRAFELVGEPLFLVRDVMFPSASTVIWRDGDLSISVKERSGL